MLVFNGRSTATPELRDGCTQHGAVFATDGDSEGDPRHITLGHPRCCSGYATFRIRAQWDMITRRCSALRIRSASSRCYIATGAGGTAVAVKK